MKNPNIAHVLRYYRKLNKLSVDDISKYLSSKNIQVASKTVYGWENGNTQPSADTLMTLCGLYHIDNVLETFGYSLEDSYDIPILLSSEEKLVIEAYRKNPRMQDAVKKLLGVTV